MQKRFAADGIPAPDFPDYLRKVETETERRVAEGEREHLIHYALQSEPIHRRPGSSRLSARAGSSKASRRRTASGSSRTQPTFRHADGLRLSVPASPMCCPHSGGTRRMPASGTSGKCFAEDSVRCRWTRSMPTTCGWRGSSTGRSSRRAGTPPISRSCIRSRPHSSDTQIEAGYGVYLGLGALHALEPDQRINRVLVVGPGLDLAPRTDLIDVVAPQTYQPLAVADALLALSIGSEANLRIQSVDVNPMVVRVRQAAAREPVTLHLFTGIAETREQPFSADNRNYVKHLGRAIGAVTRPPDAIASDRRYQHSIAVRDSITRAMSAERLNIVTQRLVDRAGFDLVVMTNVLTYFDDRQLALALSNIAAMLRPGGYLLHNESRAGLVETASSIRIPVLHMRTTILGGSTDRPLYDTVWVHQKAKILD